MLFKAILVCSFALSALASPHMLRSAHHRDLAHRAAMPNPIVAPEPVLVPQKRKRASSSRCKVRSSSAAVPTSTSVAPSSSSSAVHSTTSTHSLSSSVIIPPQNVESAAPSSATPESTKAAEPTTSAKPTTKAAPTTTTKAASPTTSASSGSSASDPLGILTGPHSGDGTFYGTGLGSCGITDSDTDFIVAISHIIYDGFPGYSGANPNNNPVCGKKIRATYQGNSVEVTVVDRCVGCAAFDLDFSPSAFDQLASESIGRLHGVQWNWV